jgi:4-hydroxy-3-methylbut-2-enyl diphosphate reductase
MSPVEKVLLASPRGFCAGVEMAIKSLAWMTRVFEPPVYCYHEIVHNEAVVGRFRSMGVIFVEDVEEVPPGAPLMLSAHGSPPELVESARERAGTLVNAVCPLVKKVHHEVKVRARKGFEIVYVGHEGHQEAIGTAAVAPDAVRRIENIHELEALPDPEGPVAFLAQTTLAVDEWQELLEAARARWPDLWVPGSSDLCFATTNRQSALKASAPRCDAIVVIGSQTSSNTLALARTATAAGCPRVMRVDSPAELPADLSGVVGVIAGASAPEEIVQAVVTALAPESGVEEVPAVDEDEYFPLPRELRDSVKQLAALAAVAGLAPGADPSAGGEPAPDDRSLSAATALAGLTR